MKIERLPMQHTYDAGTWVADLDGGGLIVQRDAIAEASIRLGVSRFTGRYHIEVTPDEARVLLEMLTEALAAVKEEE